MKENGTKEEKTHVRLSNRNKILIFIISVAPRLYYREPKSKVPHPYDQIQQGLHLPQLEVYLSSFQSLSIYESIMVKKHTALRRE